MAMVQSSLRDEIVWCDWRPWVETHGYRRAVAPRPNQPHSGERGYGDGFGYFPNNSAFSGSFFQPNCAANSAGV